MDPRTELRNSFVTGLLLIAPLAVTVFVLQFVFTRLTGVLNPIVAATGLSTLTANIQLLAQMLAASLLVLAIALVGFLAQRSGGERAIDSFDRLVNLVPLVNVVYAGVRQVSDALTAGEGRYQKVVLVEYPRLGIYSLGFVTGDGPVEADALADDETRFVIVPHSPNPTAGQLIVVPERNIHETERSVRRALRLLVTTGVAESEDELEALQDEVGGPVIAGGGPAREGSGSGPGSRAD
jgi:uncharacterized membrane protein